MAAERIIGIDFGTSTSVIRVKRYVDGIPEGSDRLATEQVVFNGTYPTVPTAIQKVGENTYYGYDALISRKKADLYQGFKVNLESREDEKRREARALTKEFFLYLAKVYKEQSDGGHLGQPDDLERTIISYPVKWTDETKSFMRETAAESGFPHVEGVDEAQAAIHAVTLQSEDYLQKQGYLTDGKPCTILLIDMGAGTTDLVLCRYTPGLQAKNEILCTWPTEGEVLFGGQEIEQILRGYISGKLPEEDAKLVLARCGSDKFKAWKENVVSPALGRGETVEGFSDVDLIVDLMGMDMEDYDLDCSVFETEALEYLKGFPQLISGCLEKSGVDSDEVELVILTGGHSQWYFAKEMLCGGMPDICGALLPKIKEDSGRVIPVSRPQETVALGLVYMPMAARLEEKQDQKKSDYVSVEMKNNGQNHTEQAELHDKPKQSQIDENVVAYYQSHAEQLIYDRFSPIDSDSKSRGYEIRLITPKGERKNFNVNGEIVIDENDKVKDAAFFVKNWYDCSGLIKKDGSIKGNGTLSGWENINKVAAHATTLASYVGLRKDGTLLSFGKNKYGQCDVGQWKNVRDISCGHAHTVAITEDGRALAAGDNRNGQCNVSHWKDIIDIKCTYNCTVGLKKNGTVVIAGIKNDGCNVDNWTDIEEICLSNANTRPKLSGDSLSIAGRKKTGEVLTTGALVSANIWNTNGWTNVVSLSCYKNRLLGLKEDGTVLVIRGKDDKYGAGNVSGWKDITLIFALSRGTVGIKKDGSLIYTTYIDKNGDGKNIIKGEMEIREINFWKM